jgi:hypothetical protein
MYKSSYFKYFIGKRVAGKSGDSFKVTVTRTSTSIIICAPEKARFRGLLIPYREVPDLVSVSRLRF